MTFDDAPFDADPPKPAMKRPGKGGAQSAHPATTELAEHSPITEKAELLALVTDKPIEVLLDTVRREELYEKIRGEIAGQIPDLTTATGRAKIKSLAYKVARTRTTLDDAGKDHTEGIRKQVDAVNKIRSAMRSTLDVLQAEALRPYTEWEAEQELIASKKRNILETISRALFVGPENLPATIEALKELAIDADLWGSDQAGVLEKRQAAIDNLTRALDAIEKTRAAAAIEAENAELRKRLAEAESRNAPDPEPMEKPEPDHAADTRDRAAREIDREAPPPAATGGGGLTIIQQRRRLALPAILEITGSDTIAKHLILAIERGDVPGIAATYLED